MAARTKMTSPSVISFLVQLLSANKISPSGGFFPYSNPSFWIGASNKYQTTVNRADSPFSPTKSSRTKSSSIFIKDCRSICFIPAFPWRKETLWKPTLTRVLFVLRFAVEYSHVKPWPNCSQSMRSSLFMRVSMSVCQCVCRHEIWNWVCTGSTNFIKPTKS